MRFRRGADPPPPPEPDDPRVAALAAEIDQARGNTSYWLLWSGDLLGDGDPVNEATAFVRRRWWHFNGDFNSEHQLGEIDEESAAKVLSWLIGNTIAYDVELMTPERAAGFTASFVSLIPAPRRWFTNGDDLPPVASKPGYAWDDATDFTFDLGVIAVADSRAWIAWFTDED
jgi:hypothetical protein